jgi:N-acetyl sugar amidotransferase
MTKENKICTRCILDTTVPEITFNEKGICNYCKIHDEIMREYPAGSEGKNILEELVRKLKKKGKGKKYDCIIGISGGTDSTYTLYLMKEMGLRPLAVHFDNGWNSEIAVQNIKNATNKLGIDLYTLVADWEEFKDMQIAFLKSSTTDAEVPTDYAIISVLLKVAAKEKIKYIIEGQASRAEGTTPLGWTYHDGKYLRSIQRKFGKLKAKSFPILSLFHLLYYFFIRRVKLVRPLEYIDYSKQMAKEVNKSNLGWKDPGGHHHESVFTKFFQSYYLPNKFNIDKRKRECSAKIRSLEMTREDALIEVSTSYPVEDGIVEYTIGKLGLTNHEFDEIMKAPIKSFLDYSTYFHLIQLMRWPIKIACKLHIFPPIFYYKYGVNHAPKIKAYWKNFNLNKYDCYS